MEKEKAVAEVLAERLREHSVRLNAARVIPTPAASSRVPLLGPLIARIRHLASRLATQWYLAPILDQQQRFAEEVTATLDELAGLVVHQDQQIQEMAGRASQQELFEAEVRQQWREFLAQVATLTRQPAQGEGPYTICLDYPVVGRPRYGHGKPPHPQLYAIIAQNKAAYEQCLTDFLRYRDHLTRICDEHQDSAPDEPAWKNLLLPGLDAVALYGFVAAKDPRNYFEIGSGNSTQFVGRAIADHGLRTRITAIDPCPRAAIAGICNLAITTPVEDVDVRMFDELGPGDMLFVDNSHRVFMNSDVTAVFLDILPRLKPGILVGFHDIYLPYDYPPAWSDRYYSEQYMLAAYLLSGGNRFEIVLPATFVSEDPRLSAVLDPLWEELKFEFPRGGASFWIQTK